MKKKVIKLDKALSLDKETVAKLNEEQLGTLEGGGTNTCNGGGAALEQEAATVNSCLACSCNGG
jgi:hypothetical protein